MRPYVGKIDFSIKKYMETLLRWSLFEQVGGAPAVFEKHGHRPSCAISLISERLIIRL